MDDSISHRDTTGEDGLRRRRANPFHVVTGGANPTNPRRGLRIDGTRGSMRREGKGRDDRMTYLSGLDSCLKMRMTFADDVRGVQW